MAPHCSGAPAEWKNVTVITWFDVGEDARGVVAIGAQATGVIAIGQVATGFVAIGQLARGVIVVGQLAAGVVTIGQLSFGVGWNAGMLGVGGTSPGWLVLPVLDRHAPLGGQLSGVRGLLRILALLGLGVVWWLLVGVPLVEGLLVEGAVLRPIPELR